MNFDVTSFTLTLGLVGSSFLLGIVVRSLGVRQNFSGTGVWVLAIVFTLVAAVALSAMRPVLEPLWLQYVVLAVLPFVVAFVGLSLLVGRQRDGDE